MPNLGYETIGATTRVLNGSVRGMKVTMPEAGQAGVTITAYVEDSATGDNFRAALIDDADDQTVLASSAVRTDISTAGWYTFSGGTLATYTPSNAEVFTVMVTSDSAANANIYHDGNAASAFEGWVGSITTIEPLVLNGPLSADTTRDFSIYVTYTSASAGGARRTVGLTTLGVS